ncbi:MAG: DUF4292 domain-containing protein [bacterium]
MRLRFRRAAVAAAACLSLLSFLGGCAGLQGRRSRPEEVSLPAPADVYEQVLQEQGKVTTLSGTAKVRLQGMEKTVQFEGVVACSRKGALRLEVLDFWDHVVFLAILRGGLLSTYSVGDKTYFQGPAGPAELKRFLGIPLEGQDLINLILGDPFFVPMDEPRLRLSNDNGNLLLDAEDEPRRVRYLTWLDRDDKRALRSYLVRSDPAGGTLSLQVSYGRHREVGSSDFPFRIRVADSANQEVLSVEYESIELDRALDERLFEFTPPADSERVTW